MKPDANKPEDRFAGETDVLDIGAHTDQLLALVDDAPHGRAQQTLYKHATTTIALFAFRAGGGLPEHSAAGTVTVQVVAGEVTMNAAAESFLLKSGCLLRIAPGVRHSVHAACNAAILVHISLEPASA